MSVLPPDNRHFAPIDAVVTPILGGMTNSPAPHVRPNRITLPALAPTLFVVAALFLPIGAFLGTINADRDVDWAIFQTQLGTVIFWFGAMSLFIGLLLVGIRSIAQQHLDFALRAQRLQRPE